MEKKEWETEPAENIKCISCMKEKTPSEMQKKFWKKNGGICKECWFDSDNPPILEKRIDGVIHKKGGVG